MCVSSYVHHCVRHCTLMMVCGNVLGKAKTTKVGMVWYEFNIVNESINESVTKVGIELLGQLREAFKKKNRFFLGKSPKLWVGGGQES